MPEFLATQQKDVAVAAEVTVVVVPLTIDYPYLAAEGLTEFIGSDGVLCSQRQELWAHGPSTQLPEPVE